MAANNWSVKKRGRGMLGYYAGFTSRFVAMLIDVAIVIVLVFTIYLAIRLPIQVFLGVDPNTCQATDHQSMLAQIVGTIFPTSSGPVPAWFCAAVDLVFRLIAVLAAPVYFGFFYSATGQTLGMYAMGVRVVRMDGKAMSFFGGIWRWICVLIAILPMGIGVLWVVVDDRRQGWHDKLAHTCVIYAWNAEQNVFLVNQVKRWLWGDRVRRLLGRPDSTPTLGTAKPPKLDLLTIAFPDYDRLDNVLNTIQDGIDEDKYSVVNATVLVKGDGDSVGVLAASDLAVGTKVNNMADEPLMLPDYELKRIMANVPAQHFVVALVTEDHHGDSIVRAVSREANALVRRYDLDETGKGAKKVHPVTAVETTIE
jgi:uncharacterized RDD family membrane protein YckC